MHHHFAVRPQRVSLQILRRVGTLSPPSPRNTNLLFFTLAASAAVGAYYFMRKAPPEDLSTKAKRDEEDMTQKARESLDAARSRGDVARKQTQQKYEEFKTQTSMGDGAQDAQSRVKELSSDAKSRYESYKDAASDTLSKTRGSVERVYDNTKATTDEKLAEVRSESQKIQQGWFSWLGWGKSNAQRRENRSDVQRASGATSAGKRAEKDA